MNKNINKFVKDILTNDFRAREDDHYLIAQIIKKKCTRASMVNLIYALEHAKDFGLPSFESITRARRDIQKQDKELVEKGIENIRDKEEKEYHEFYGG